MSTTPTTPHRVITRRVVDWAAWDWGSAAFNAVATTFVFTTYLTSDGVFTDAGTASSWLSNGMTIAGLFIALLAPITGQRADRRGRGGVWLGWFTGLVVACMLAMYFVHPASVLGPKGALMLGIALLGLGNVFFEFASVNYNAMLNHLGEKEDRGKISGFGWAAGYIGGIVLLLILYVGLIGLIRARVPRFHPSMWLDGVIGALGTTALGVAKPRGVTGYGRRRARATVSLSSSDSSSMPRMAMMSCSDLYFCRIP